MNNSPLKAEPISLNPKKLLEAIRSSTFGGLVLAGISIIVYFSFPSYFLSFPLLWFVFSFFILGTALHKAIDKTVKLLFLNHSNKIVSFHEQLSELDRLLEEKRITPVMYQHLVNKLCEKRFLE